MQGDSRGDSFRAMKPLGGLVAADLDLKGALVREAATRRNLIPSEPGFDALLARSDVFSGWLSAQLRAGLRVSTPVVVAARKFGHGVRPVPILGLPDRIVYRAVTDHLLSEEAPLDRSHPAYLAFVGAPIRHALDQSEIEIPSSAASSRFSIRYVVKTDLTAFYQYVDHGILAAELVNRLGRNDEVEVLMTLLDELQGRAFGLPQLFDASDALSDIYGEIMERDLLRQGWPVWRFNDDFRIAVESYSGALRALEALDASARNLGLVISEQKTFTPKLETYLSDTYGDDASLDNPDPSWNPSDDDPPLALQEVSYADVGMSPDNAVSVLSQLVSLDLAESDWPRLSDLTPAQTRSVGASIRALTRAEDARAMDLLVPLLLYVPALTPTVVDYLVANASHEPARVAERAGEIASRVPLSDWQSWWLLYLLRVTNLPNLSERLLAWCVAQRTAQHPVVRAEATLHASQSATIALGDLEYLLRSQPASLVSWYVLAARNLHDRTQSPSTERLVSSLKSSSRYYACLLEA